MRPHVTVAAACFAVQNNTLFVLLLRVLLQLKLLARGVQSFQSKIFSISPPKLFGRGRSHLVQKMRQKKRRQRGGGGGGGDVQVRKKAMKRT
jgi:hypothetical protein